jgi:hypothetical protein
MPTNLNSSMLEDLVESGELKGDIESSQTENQQQSQAAATAESALSGNDNVSHETNPSTQLDFDAVLAEKTGGKFKSVDEILKLTEQTYNPEINFVNETSKKVFEYLKEGKVDEIMSVYQQQKQLEGIDKLDTDAVLKLRLKYENPELTDSELQDEFESRYGVEQPDIDEDLDDAADIEKAKKRYEREKSAMERLKKKDLKEAKDFLQEKKQEIVLPDIATSKSQEQVPQGNEVDEAAIKEFRDKYVKSIDSAMNEVTGFGTKYKDDELDFQTAFVIDQAEKQNLKQSLEKFTLQDYFVPRYIKEDGSFNTTAIAKDVYVLENLNKIIDAHVSQAVNNTKSLLIKGLKNANFQDTTMRQPPSEQLSKEQEMADYFFANT